MTVEELKMVTKICAHMETYCDMDYRTAYSFALAVVQNKELIKKVLAEGSEGE